jgi:hypothetical protein
MESYDYGVGKKVRIGHRHSRAEFRSMIGTIKEGFGHPNYPALNVLLEDRRLEAFCTTNWTTPARRWMS